MCGPDFHTVMGTPSRRQVLMWCNSALCRRTRAPSSASHGQGGAYIAPHRDRIQRTSRLARLALPRVDLPRMYRCGHPAIACTCTSHARARRRESGNAKNRVRESGNAANLYVGHSWPKGTRADDWIRKFTPPALTHFATWWLRMPCANQGSKGLGIPLPGEPAGGRACLQRRQQRFGRFAGVQAVKPLCIAGECSCLMIWPGDSSPLLERLASHSCPPHISDSSQPPFLDFLQPVQVCRFTVVQQATRPAGHRSGTTHGRRPNPHCANHSALCLPIL